MLVYSTEFPTRIGKTLEDFISACHLWLSGSPHYPYQNLPQIDIPDGDIIDISREGHQLQIAAINEEARRRAGVKHTWIESARQTWTTELVASEDAEGLWISVNVSCEVITPGAKPPVPKKPYIIKQLFSQLGGGDDGSLVVQDRPHFLTDSQIDLAAVIIEGKLSNHLPITYISCDFSGHSYVDVDEAARRLAGIAHVVVEPSRYFSLQLARRVGLANPYGGAVGLYWPSAQGRRIKYLPGSFNSSWELLDNLEKGVRTGWLFWRSPRNNSWAYIKESISLRKLNELRERGSESFDEYSRIFDQENDALREQMRQAESRNAYLEETLRALQDRESSRGDLAFMTGIEQEFYPGELRDAILKTLAEDLTSFTTDSRRSILVHDFVSANEASDAAEQLEASIKDCLAKTERITPETLKRLSDLGFRITEEGKHYKAVFQGDPRFTFSIFKTASDHRSGKNLASDITKKLVKR